MFGVLAYSEFKSGGEVFGRSYSVEPVSIPGARVRTRPEGIGLSIWPPKHGIADTRAFVRLFESHWAFIAANIDRILVRALPVIQEGISDFWGLPEPCPTAQALLDGAELWQINISAGAGAGHELILNDRADLIGSHDLSVHLDEEFNPVSASFDG